MYKRQPVINAYQALVKTERVALCNATDSKLIAGHFPGVDTYPMALGHENAGIVAVSYTHLDVYKRQVHERRYSGSKSLVP